MRLPGEYRRRRLWGPTAGSVFQPSEEKRGRACAVSGYGALPDLGLVDTLGAQTDVQLVGYGIEYHIGEGPPYWTLDYARHCALAELLSSTDINVRVSANIGQDKGFAGQGDSGGPVLHGDTDTILALISFSTNVQTRMGVTYASRVDIPEVLEWIESFLN